MRCDRLDLHRSVTVPDTNDLVELLATNVAIPQHFRELDGDGEVSWGLYNTNLPVSLPQKRVQGGGRTCKRQTASQIDQCPSDRSGR